MKTLFAIASLFFAVLLASCGAKTDVITYTYSTAEPGDIIGTIYQVYDTLYQPMTDKSGVNVSLLGTSYSAVTDQSGKWHLQNIQPGTYTIRFSKEGYVSSTRQNFVFTGNGTYFYEAGPITESPYMYPLPNLFPNLVLRQFEDLVQLNYRRDSIWDGSIHRMYDTIITNYGIATFSSRSQFMYHNRNVYGTIFFAKSNHIDPTDPSSFLYLIFDNETNDSSGFANFNVLKSDLLQSGFSEDERIYCCAFAYANTNQRIDSWIDPNTGRNAYSGFSPYHSEVKSFILP